MNPLRLHALLIGIDSYAPGSKLVPLRGCVNDARAIEARLRIHHPDAAIALLLNEQATHSAVVRALQELANTVQGGDVVWVHYSGHGSATRSNDAANPAGMDESLVLWESRIEGGQDLRDKEFGALLGAIAERGAEVCVVLDCCHAGGQTRAKIAAVRACPPDLRASPSAGSALAVETSASDALDAVTILSACRDDEKAVELLPSSVGNITIDALWHGAATWFLLRALDTYTPEMTWARLHESVCAGIRVRYAHQTPQLAGPGERLLFGGSGGVQRASLLVLAERADEQGRAVQVNGGIALGIDTGARLSLHSTDCKLESPPLATATVTSAEVGNAWARLDTGAPITLPQEIRARITAYGYERPRLAISATDEAFLAAFADANEPLLEVTDIAQAEILIQRQGDFLYCTDGAGINLLKHTFAIDASGIVALLAALKQIAVYRNVQRLVNRSVNSAQQHALAIAPPLALAPSRSALAAFGQATSLRRAQNGGWELPGNRRLGLVITNRSRDKVLVRVLALLPDWSIVSVEPKGTGQTTVASGATLLVTHKPMLPTDLAGGEIIYKIFATSAPVDFEPLLLPPLLSAPLKSVTRHSGPLDWLLDAVRRTGTRPVRSPTADDQWYASEVRVKMGNEHESAIRE